MSLKLQERFDRAVRAERNPRAARAEVAEVETLAVQGELYHEDAVATLLGIARQRLRQVRKHLRPVEHWTMDLTTRKLAYTAAGLKLLREILPARVGSAAGEQIPANGLETAKAGFPRTEKLRVCRVYPNPRLMLCARVSAPELGILVKVRDNANFIQGMLIDATEDALHHWQYCGRLPRKRGKL